MQDYKLSFIVPVYNVELFIEECLQSILNQIDAFPGSEIIVINDGTPDNSMTIVDRLAKQYPCIRVYNQENRGLSATRNLGIELAKGDYIWFVDSDDWLEPYALDTLKDTMKNYPDIDVYITGLNCYKQSEIVYSDFPNIKTPEYLDGWSYLKKYPQTPAQRFIVRRSIFDFSGLKFIPRIVHEDNPYGLELMTIVSTVKLLNKPIYAYRVREGSIMTTINIRSAYDLLTGYRALMEFGDNKVISDRKKQFKVYSLNTIMMIFELFQCQMSNADFKYFWAKEKYFIRTQIKETFPYIRWSEMIMWVIIYYNPHIYYRYISQPWISLKKFLCGIRNYILNTVRFK